MSFNMTLETDNQNDGRPATDDSQDASGQAFIGCNVRAEIKLRLWNMAMSAPGGSRPLSWAINQVLEQHFNKERSGNDKQ